MITNTRESMLAHENEDYIASRPDWVYGKIPSLSDYRKLSVDNFKEAFTLARLGQEMAASVMPTIKGKPTRLTFTQSLIVGAAVIDRPNAEKLGLDFEKYRSVLMVTPSRYGKQNAYATPVITTKGWKKHGELEPGKDYVFHPDGHPIKVLATKSWPSDHYNVHFQNGQVIECHARHEWYVWDRTYTKVGPRPERKVLQRGRYCVMETQEMVERGYLQKDGNGYRPKFLVDPTKPLQFDAKEQPLDPYFFGCWLGDGTSKRPLLTLSPEKAEHILSNIPYRISTSHELQGCTQYSFAGQDIVSHLHDLSVFGNKHIPDCYKYGSPEQQQALLAGIIDTDGYIDRNGRVIISCANERLAKDIMELLIIMGECPYETVVPPTASSSSIVGKSDVHMIGYQPAYELPTKFKRLPRLTPHRKIGITKIEKVEHGEPGNCIQVDSPDGLYLVGEKLVPTHNSFLNAIACIIMAGVYGKEVNIGGATKDKSGIIQNKIVQMIPDTVHDIQDGLVVDNENEDINKRIQRLATQTSKESLMWRNGGSIKLFSTNEGNKSADVQAAGAIGIGGDYCVFDEVQLMSHAGFRTASRFMMEGPDTKRFCVGNPQINGHFRELYDDPETFVIHINDITAIVEQRMTRKGFELTGIPTYSNEYRAFIQVEFPDEHSGTRFFTKLPSVYDEANFEAPYSKKYFIGIDSAYTGADGIIVTLMSLNECGDKRWVVIEEQFDAKKGITDFGPGATMDIALSILKLWDKYNVIAGAIDIGYGIHIYEKMMELYPELPLQPINFASKPTESRIESDYNAKYALNKRAEIHLDMKDLCENDLIFIKNEYYDEMLKEMQEVGNTPEMNKVKIEPKKKIKERLGRSPDHLDSACLAVHAMVLSGALSGAESLTDEDLMEVIE